MRAWYFIGIAMALVPLYFRFRTRQVRTPPPGITDPAGQDLHSERRLMMLLILLAIGAVVFAWTATPPIAD